MPPYKHSDGREQPAAPAAAVRNGVRAGHPANVLAGDARISGDQAACTTLGPLADGSAYSAAARLAVAAGAATGVREAAQ